MSYTYIKKTESALILGFSDGSNVDGGVMIPLNRLSAEFMSDNDGIPICNIKDGGSLSATIDRYAFWQDGDYDNNPVQIYFDDMGVMKLFSSFDQLKAYVKTSILMFSRSLRPAVNYGSIQSGKIIFAATNGASVNNESKLSIPISLYSFEQREFDGVKYFDIYKGNELVISMPDVSVQSFYKDVSGTITEITTYEDQLDFFLNP